MKSCLKSWFAAAATCASLLQGYAIPANAETVLHNFGVAPNDGVLPAGGLTNIDGNLFGMTFAGGVSTACNGNSQPGCGTVFKITTRGKEKVLYSFQGGDDGRLPSTGSLINVNGTLYGATMQGGTGNCALFGSAVGCGTVFSITTQGKEKVLYSFQGVPDGYSPAGLIDVKGTLYGTTTFGGIDRCRWQGSVAGCGTVFSIDPGGTEKVLYSFKNGNDGAWPQAGMIDVNGTLYGTTEFGGGIKECDRQHGAGGCGTVFSIDPSGTEKVLYAFKYDKDGGNPMAALVKVQDDLYGTTPFGGGPSDGGTVFSINSSGTETVLHRFGGFNHGGAPYAPLLNIKGTLYGTGAFGAQYSSGMVFSITTSGKERMLYAFKSTDGLYPQAPLLEVGGQLYGATIEGGSTFGSLCYGVGCGVVFSLKP